MASPDRRPNRPPSGYRYLGLGIQMAVSILLFVLLGQWIDGKLKTGGIFTILGALVGFGGTMLSLFRDLSREADRGDERDQGK